MIRDRRRTKNDRRTDIRYAAQIKIEWEGLAGKQSGMISDISETGCFVLCSGAAKDGEKVKLYFPVGHNQTFELLGEIISHDYEIGYALRFIEIEEIERLFLEHLINNLKKTSHPIIR
jgi:hypothetical protein